MKTIKQPSKTQMNQLRAIAKAHGIKGCKMGRFFAHVGKQTASIENGHAILDALVAEGFHVDGLDTCRQLADKGLLDVVMVAAQ